MLMRDMLAERNALYFHFLQPNQYFSHEAIQRSRGSGRPERGVAVQEERRNRVWSDRRGRRCAREQNVRFFDATRVFDREPAHVYMDDCCHYTQAGNYVLADFIAASILSSPGPWR